MKPVDTPNKIDSWNQFIQQTQRARKRNGGLQTETMSTQRSDSKKTLHMVDTRKKNAPNSEIQTSDCQYRKGIHIDTYA